MPVILNDIKMFLKDIFEYTQPFILSTEAYMNIINETES